MIQYHRLEHRFVKHIPEALDPGVLYVSMEYATSAHSCCCGCGSEVVTPITPTDWKITFDGETVSLSPSIGNWALKCRSHYFIGHGTVIEAAPWGDEHVEAAHRRDRTAKARYYGKLIESSVQRVPEIENQGRIRKAWNWLTERFK